MDQTRMEIDKRNKRKKVSLSREYQEMKKAFVLSNLIKFDKKYGEKNPPKGRRPNIPLTDEQKKHLRDTRARHRRDIAEEDKRIKENAPTWSDKLPNRDKSLRIAKQPAPDPDECEQEQSVPPDVQEPLSLEQKRRGSRKLIDAIQENAKNLQQEVERLQKEQPGDFIFWQPQVNADMTSFSLPEEVSKAISSFNACSNPDAESTAKVEKFNVQLKNWTLHLTEQVTRAIAHGFSFPSTLMTSTVGGVFDMRSDLDSLDVLPIYQPSLITTTPKAIVRYISENNVWGPPFPKLTLPNTSLCDDPWAEFEGKSCNDGWLNGRLDQALTILDANSLKPVNKPTTAVINALWELLMKTRTERNENFMLASRVTNFPCATYCFTLDEAMKLFGNDADFELRKGDAARGFRMKCPFPIMVYIPVYLTKNDQNAIVVIIDLRDKRKPKTLVYDNRSRNGGPITRIVELDEILTRIFMFFEPFLKGTLATLLKKVRYPKPMLLFQNFSNTIDQELTCLAFAGFVMHIHSSNPLPSSAPTTIHMSAVRTWCIQILKKFAKPENANMYSSEYLMKN